MPSSFCHIHNHTEYSLLDGANRIPSMVARAKELGMDSLAITDHGVMFGVMEFYFECKAQGIKPLLGVEAYVAPQGRHKRTGREENQTYHLLLLARNLQGYRNLCKLSSIAALEGYYYKPRIDHEVLRQHSEGLFGTSACLGSEICQALLRDDYAAANRLAGLYSEIFGEGNFFIELQDHGLPEQARIREPLIRIASDLKLPLVATNDAHYLCSGDAKAHDVLLCVQTGALVADEKRLKFGADSFYLKSPDEMQALFGETPEALENTLRIADLCDVELGKQHARMPEPELPDGETSRTYLRKLATEALPSRIAGADEPALRRLDYELDVIERTGFEDYFLLVREFALATRERGIYFGVRGSAAGSLVSHCLGITDVNPLEYGLTFERFLNPERVSMPDIDMDFEDARRDEIIQWVSQKYGADHVAQIVTFGTMGAKASIKDCGRVLNVPPQETDRICKTIPSLPGWTLARAYKESAEFRQMVDGDPKVRSLVEMAKSVEGLARHCGVHAAGVVISREPLAEHVPLYRSNDGQPITAYEMGILEKIGLLKMDFLGLSNLTVLAKTVENIRRRGKGDVDVKTLPDGDSKTYDMLARGETIGVFQLEGGGMTRYVQQLKPQSVRELAAMVALYRPGPMEHIPRFIDAKFGRAEVEVLDERMRPILEETYGVIVYQDQVLQLVQALAGFSLGRADILRRAMGKKDAKAMASMKKEFLAGAAENGTASETAEKVWELLLPFAGYAFNKAHAVCYALLAYQTAYLKANYPVEYMAALLAAYRAKEDRVVASIEECRRQRIPIMPPDVNSSGVDFIIEDHPMAKEGAIRFGLAAIKGVGEGIVEAILVDRAENGPYRHLWEFCERLRPEGLNRTAVEALVRAGAFDGIDPNRAKLLAVVDAGVAYADAANRSKEAGQDSLFEGGAAPEGRPQLPELPSVPMPQRGEILAMEKEVLGIYVSDHPLRGLERTLAEAASQSCSQVTELEEQTTVRLAGVIASLRTMITRAKGEKMAAFTLEDFSGQASVIAFPSVYARLGALIVKDKAVQISGVVMHRERLGNGGERTIEIRLEGIRFLEPALDLADPEPAAGAVLIRLRTATEPQLRLLRTALERHPGSYNVRVQVLPTDRHRAFLAMPLVEPTEALQLEIAAALSGAEVVFEHREGSLAASA